MMFRSGITIIALALALLSACRSHDYSGTWKGTTSQGKEFSINIKENKVATMTVAYKLDCRKGGFCPVEGSISGDVDKSAIEGGKITASFGNGTITGTFDSDNSASGELKVVAPDQSGCDCSADIKWTAKKQ